MLFLAQHIHPGSPIYPPPRVGDEDTAMGGEPLHTSTIMNTTSSTTSSPTRYAPGAATTVWDVHELRWELLVLLARRGRDVPDVDRVATVVATAQRALDTILAAVRMHAALHHLDRGNNGQD